MQKQLIQITSIHPTIIDTTHGVSAGEYLFISLAVSHRCEFRRKTVFFLHSVLRYEHIICHFSHPVAHKCLCLILQKLPLLSARKNSTNYVDVFIIDNFFNLEYGWCEEERGKRDSKKRKITHRRCVWNVLTKNLLNKKCFSFSLHLPFNIVYPSGKVIEKVELFHRIIPRRCLLFFHFSPLRLPSTPFICYAGHCNTNITNEWNFSLLPDEMKVVLNARQVKGFRENCRWKIFTFMLHSTACSCSRRY